MMRRSFVSFAAAAAAGGAATASAANPKMQALHKLLIGESHFKNKVPLKESYVIHQFGEKWESEMAAYIATVSADQKKVLERQLARLKLTRYTTRELAMYCGEGPEHLDDVAREENIKQAVAYLKMKGPEEFETYVQQEAANANWKPEDAKKFIDAVKAKAK